MQMFSLEKKKCFLLKAEKVFADFISTANTKLVKCGNGGGGGREILFNAVTNE
jgi:hypothetical protein